MAASRIGSNESNISSNSTDIGTNSTDIGTINGKQVNSVQNTYSSTIPSSGTTVPNQRPTWIQSISWVSTGRVNITWSPGAFVVAPALTFGAGAQNGSDGSMVSLLSNSSTGCQLLIESPGGSFISVQFFLIAVKAGIDYKTKQAISSL